MFRILKKYRINSNLPLIESNYDDIYFHELPMLYVGTNHFGNRIVGSLLFEDEENLMLRYIHVIFTDHEYNVFINGIKPYRELLENSKNIFVIDKDYNDNPIYIYHMAINNIPKSYLPVKDFYCPQNSYSLGSDFILSLHGNIADNHQANPKELNRIQDVFVRYLDKSLELLRYSRHANILALPQKTGSFQLRYNISFKNYDDLFVKQDEIYAAIGKIFKNIVSLSNIDSKTDETLNMIFKNDEIITTISKIINPGNSKLTTEQQFVVNHAFEKLVELLSDLSQNIGYSYNEIEILSSNRNSDELLPMASLNKSSQNKLIELYEFIESENNKIETDVKAKEYRIWIYSLNTETRNGRAYINNPIKLDVIDNISIKIQGNESTDNSKFTESIHHRKWIVVEAKATIKNDKFSRLLIVK